MDTARRLMTRARLADGLLARAFDNFPHRFEKISQFLIIVGPKNPWRFILMAKALPLE